MDVKQWLLKLPPPVQGDKHDDLPLRVDHPACEARNAHAHLHSLLLGDWTSLPVISGKLLLDLYQEIILVELDGPRRRNIIMTLKRN